MRLAYLSPVPWNSFAQRPHKFVEWFHGRGGGDVLWIDPYPTRLPGLADFRRARAEGKSSTERAPKWSTPSWLTVLRPRSLPIEPLPGAGALNRVLWNEVLQAVAAFVGKGECLLGIGKPSELALQVLARYPGLPSLYDAMDDFPAFYRGISRLSMEKRERRVAARVSRLLVSSSALADRFAAHREKLSLAHNACAPETLPPASVMRKRPGKPVLGYVGTIGHWFDWSLVFDLAEANPSLCVRLIGPARVVPRGHMPRNIELRPAVDHVTAIESMQEFSVGLIPFKRTDLTASVDPIKYYEYRALGLPVLSTRFGEMALREGLAGVFLLDAHSDPADAVASAMACEQDIGQIREFRAANSWQARFDACGVLP